MVDGLDPRVLQGLGGGEPVSRTTAREEGVAGRKRVKDKSRKGTRRGQDKVDKMSRTISQGEVEKM